MAVCIRYPDRTGPQWCIVSSHEAVTTLRTWVDSELGSPVYPDTSVYIASPPRYAPDIQGELVPPQKIQRSDVIAWSSLSLSICHFREHPFVRSSVGTTSDEASEDRITECIIICSRAAMAHICSSRRRAL